ncbi:SGNH/GDSL hydrolase family protein [Candidatus Seribacter sulfatis]|uniref:SGNH/GDSL hydrolase family protein n=1 Tax=Candidatus Seribacter sulfatis TaxID=3381756 RepID=UPI00389A9F8D
MIRYWCMIVIASFAFTAVADTSSMFLDETSIRDHHRMEDFYGLEEGKTYDMSFRFKKEGGSHPKGGHLGVMLQVTSQKTKKGSKQFILRDVGADVPADGGWHTVRASFTVAAPTGHTLRKGRYGAVQASLIVYNKTHGGVVSISDLAGVPKHETYAHLGRKDPSLPQVLLVGDSTMMHTYPAMVETFSGKAAIHYIPVNSGHSRGAVQRIRRWLGDKKWDLIYFNSGIHDLTRQDASGKKGNEHPNRVELSEYAANLQQIVEVLKGTGAKVLWRSITPLASDVPGRMQSDELRYNATAAQVMKKNSVAVHDVSNTYRQQLTALLSDGVHFNKDGNKLLANALREELSRRNW